MAVLLFNLFTVCIGSVLGMLLRKRIRQKVVDGIMVGIGACVVLMGATGLSADVSVIAILLAFAFSGFVGYALDLEGVVDRAGDRLEQRITRGKSEMGPANGAISFFLISCTGAYTINASFQAGMGHYDMLYTKAIMDLIVSMSMSTSMGGGVILAAIPMVIYQGALMLLSGVLAPLMSPTMLAAFSCAGALVTLMIGLNMIGATRIKVVNFVPALLAAPFTALLTEYLSL